MSTLFSRRHFLSHGIQLLSVAATIPAFLDRSAFALTDDHSAKKTDRVLVVVQLAGGNDGLNTIIPVTSDDYYKARPKLAVAKDKALKLDDTFSAHPAAVGFKKLYDAGHLAILHAVGYPNHNRSHFRSTDIWTSAEPEKNTRSGWLGRYCDACWAGEDPAPDSTPTTPHPLTPKPKLPDPATALALSETPPPALIGDRYVPMSFGNPDSLSFRKAQSDKARAAFDKLSETSTQAMLESPDDPDHRPPANTTTTAPAGGLNDDTAAFLQRSALNARLYADRIRSATVAAAANTTYPQTAFAQDLKLVAQMIASDLPTRVYYVKLGGFDTHAGQANRHAQLLGELAGALAAFVDDLKALGHFERTTLMTFSEFGRRVHENGSGTDHGEAAPLFLVGPNLNPGFHGDFPSLAPDKLHRGDVPYTTDFRALYATILKSHLGVDPDKVLGKPFKQIDIFKSTQS